MTDLHLPPELVQALVEAGLEDEFQGMSFSHRREYADWVDEAKQEETRHDRARRVIGMLAERGRD